MTCKGCTEIVHDLLLKVNGVKKADVDISKSCAKIEMKKHIPISVLQAALADSIYTLSAIKNPGKTKQKGDLSNIKKLVSDYITAVGQKQYDKLLKLLHSNFAFNGAMTLHSANDYINMLKEHAASSATNIVLENDIKAIFADVDEAWVIYDIVTVGNISNIPCLEQIKVNEGKIESAHLRFNKNSMKQVVQQIRNERA